MRKIKKIVKKIEEQILAEDTFFEDVLLPIYNVNCKEETKKLNQRNRKKLITVFMTSLLTIVATVSIVVAILLRPTIPIDPDPNYLNHYETKPSDTITLNQSLSNIQITGEFDSVMATYCIETLKYNLFSINKEIVIEETLVTINMIVIVDKDYPYDSEAIEYNDKFDFLDYELEYKEEAVQSMFEDIPVNEFTVKAYFETEYEIIYITYNEITCNDFSNFKKFIEKLIIRK